MTTNRKARNSNYSASRRILLHLSSIAIASAFVRQSRLVTKHRRGIGHHVVPNSFRMISRAKHVTAARTSLKLNGNVDRNTELDALLEDPSNLRKAINFLKLYPGEIEISRDRFGRIFDAIEERTSDAELEEQQNPVISEARKEMTDMYMLLNEQGHLRLFGSITKENMPASGSHTVRPTMLETITSLSMSSLTPQPSNTLTYAGAVAALAEAAASQVLGWNLNVMFFVTIGAALCDQVFLGGAVGETIVKILSPEAQPKITRHEAGHFLCSYILGCPVEGYVLSSWGALQDPRFRGRGASAATSFFDPILSSQIETSKITRSSIDRYSVIVMAGIAAEAVMYGKADGGASDEQALIGFLSNLNGGSLPPPWNDQTIRNQARWGALQSVLILREYKECYDALVDALERDGSLGDCIYAIENAARQHNKEPLRIPLGYISEEGGYEVWTKVIPNKPGTDEIDAVDGGKVLDPVANKASINPEESLEALREYKATITKKLKDIEEKLEGL